MVNTRVLVLFYVCAVAHAASLHGAGDRDIKTPSGRVDYDVDSAQVDSGVANIVSLYGQVCACWIRA